jgi:hypothetical protein
VFVAAAIVSALLALAAIGSGFGKLTKQPKVVESLTGIGVPMTWFPRLAAAEIAGGVGLLAGLKLAPLGIAAAIGLVAYFVGAVASHVRAKDKNIAPPAALGALAVAALVLRAVTM